MASAVAVEAEMVVVVAVAVEAETVVVAAEDGVAAVAVDEAVVDVEGA